VDEPSLRAAWDRARAAWPEVTVALDVFAAWCRERATDGAELHTDDLYLACACAHADPAALREFEARLLPKVPLFLSGLAGGTDLLEETIQQLRIKLFVRTDDGPPKITQYSGRGTLESWLRVVVVRTALNLLRSESQHGPLDDGASLGGHLLDEPDLELEYIKAEHRGELKAAFKEVVRTLPQRDRMLLRLHYVDQLVPERIGDFYGVHRTTAMRWLQSAQSAILTSMRRLLIERLRLTPSECDSLLELVRSHIQVTLSSLLRT
jgi:RNA polymerase sigma-70 factor (ECF subfamily)